MPLKTIYHKAPTSQNALSFWISLQVCVGAGVFVSIGAQSKRFDVDERKMDVRRAALSNDKRFCDQGYAHEAVSTGSCRGCVKSR
ncbi:MAG: hypothetical protein QOH71_862 [Blastocatellia bacterium]|nr:hypothetical protein [Blastocatellia bacterium]